MKPAELKTLPTVYVVLGATGDLVSRKIIPALFHLYDGGKLPALFQVIGFARREFSDEEFRVYLADVLRKHPDAKKQRAKHRAFLNHVVYHRGDLTMRAGYRALAKRLGHIDGQWRVCSNKLFHLAVPPRLYKTIFEHLAASGLTVPCGPGEGWTRVIVEKPFGKNAKTAEKLDELLGKLFREEQIYRIDHYLGKEIMQNILAFRFSNNLFEEPWDKDSIERIEVRLLEKLGVEDRGPFYDGVGALRDVGQNHLLQMLALVTMEHPGSFNAQAIRTRRAEVLRTLEIPDTYAIKQSTLRAQYKGYDREPGVARGSRTETYFKLRTALGAPRWQGVPIILESGKRMPENRKEIVITFKHSGPCLCPPGKDHLQNQIIFRVEPREEILVRFWAKKPGLAMDIEERTFRFDPFAGKNNAKHTEPYAKLLLDCIQGNQMLFVSTDEVAASWRFIDPIARAWIRNSVSLVRYEQGKIPFTRVSRSLRDIAPPVLMPSNVKQFTFSRIRTSRESVNKGDAASAVVQFKKEIGIVGLGKMGGGLARRLVEKGWRVVGYNRTREVTDEFAKEGLVPAYSYRELVAKLPKPRIVWLMVPAMGPVDEVLFGKGGLCSVLRKGDVVIDGGNSFYENTVRRSRELTRRGIRFLDVGVSGGPGGARSGACLMIGGEGKLYQELEGLFRDLATSGGYAYMGKAGAGHFVKMVHNGIEYGMMQALAEGFAVLKKSPFKLDLKKVAELYNHGSVITSRLVGWLKSGFENYGEDLRTISGSVAHTGEGEWTVKTAKKFKVPTPIIEGAFQFRVQSAKRPSYIGKILGVLRNQFGGHSIAGASEKKKK